MFKMKRILFLILLIVPFTNPTSAYIDTDPSINTIDESINPGSAYSEDLNVTALGLITVFTNPDNDSIVYHLTIHNATNYLVISRYNVTGDLTFNFLWEGIFRVYIWNPGETIFEIDIEFHSDAAIKAEGFGYYFEFDNNRCLETIVYAGAEKIISIAHLERGEYKIKISSYEDNAKLSFYLSNLDPAEETDWKDSAKSLSGREYLEKNMKIEKGYDWMILSSDDGYDHTIMLVMIYVAGIPLRTQDIVIAIALVSALLLLFTTQLSNRKKRKSRRSYYSTKPTKEEVQKQLHLVSQVDIRYEGTRYVYIPPDLTDPDLLDEGLVEDEKSGKLK